LFAFRAGAVASEDCAPFESPYPPLATVAAAAADERGVAPSGTGEARAGGAGGAIVSLPSGSGPGSAEPAAGEALLALPKRADGTLASDFELGAGVRIADSYWSPVLCATVALLVGPPGATLAQLVPRVPAGGAAAPHDVYSTAAVALRPAPPIPAPDEPARLAQATEGGAAPPQPDPYRSLQYGLDRLGADGAWARSRGSGVRVALLDSAPEVAHRDLAGVEVAAIDGGPGTVPATHGTLMAGVMRAVAGNGFGIAGVAPAAELIAVPVCTPAGASASDACRLYDMLRGIDRAFELGAAVLNLSLVGPPNPLLERAMARIEKLGAVAVAAAGNEGTSEPRYPAAYASVIGVGAVDAEGAPFARGNSGPSVEILAPGVEVLSTVPGNAFAFGEGTSLAAAHVSAALALLVGAGVEPGAARTALFQAAEAARSPTASTAAPPSLPPLCGALERLAKACP
jgi:subtilisin family serine protease